MKTGARVSWRLFLGLSLLLFSQTGQATTISTQVLDGMYLEGLSSSAFKIDSDGHKHVVFGSDEFYYGYNDGSGWSFRVIDSFGLSSSASLKSDSLAIDADGFAHVIYDNDDSNLQYATNRSGSWVSETVTGIDHKPAAIAIDSAHHAHVVFFDLSNNQFLYYATNATGSWQVEEVDTTSSVISYAAIAVGGDGKPRIAYSRNDDSLYFAEKDGSGVWTPAAVDSTGSVGTYLSMALDSTDQAHISYYDEVNHNLKYATNPSGVWQKSTVEDTTTADDGQYTTLTVDGSNNIHIAYLDHTNDDLRYVKSSSGSFAASQLIYDGTADFEASIAIASDGTPVVLYFDDTYNLLKSGELDDDVWTNSTIFEANNLGFGGNASPALAVDSAGHLFISYVRASDLHFATNESGSWQLSKIDDTASFEYSNLVLDATGQPHVSYTNSTTDDVKYATFSSDTWNMETAAGSGVTIENYNNLVVDSSGVVNVAYKVEDDGIFYLATADGSGGWTTSVIDDSGLMTHDQFALLKSSSGTLYACYYRDRELVCANNGSGTWVHETVDADGMDWTYINGVIDSSDAIHLSYYDGNNQNLKYATNASGTWQTAVVDSTGSVGEFNDIALDDSGKAYISYYDETNTKLKYATNVSGSWITDTLDSTTGGIIGVGSSAVFYDNKLYVAYYDDMNTNLNLATVDFDAEAPSPETSCEDDADNDSDGLADCLDSDCSDDAACAAPATPETLCEDGLDNDSDGLADCLDSDCTSDAACEVVAVTTETLCQDGLDDDADSLVDCQDSDCAADTACQAAGDDDDDDAPSENGGSSGGCQIIENHDADPTILSYGLFGAILAGIFVLRPMARR